ncbi:MAG: hypothetical protein IAG10_31150 [Planctomycetaceae bacterium]|nr:hypothetical protein [Planctomycetaceae bacterium]
MTDDLINVAVPRQHLARVYGLIAELDAGGVATAMPSPAPAVPAGNGNDEWTPSRIRRMVQESDTAMRAILTELATHAEEWLTTTKLAAAIGGSADWNTVAGTLGAFGRRRKSRYGLDTMPYERRREPGVGKVLRMSKEMAQQVLEALKNGD